MKMLDLFSGIGGFSVAAEWAGIETVAFCEKDTFCQQVLAKNFPGIPIHHDVRNLTTIPDVDLITAGFPCQPFSVAGKQKGINDDRYLWHEVMRIIRLSKPAWFIGENVPGIIPHLDPILEDLEKEGYEWRTFLIPASAVGAPHKRERLWIIANRDSVRCYNGSHHRCERRVSADEQRHIEAAHADWKRLQPVSWTTFNTQDWLVAPNTDSGERDQGAEDHEAVPVRSEWQEFTAKARDAIGDTDSIANPQTDQTDESIGEQGQARVEHGREYWRGEPIFDRQEDKPPIPGVDDGVPFGLHRNKALGNSIVPQIPYFFMRMILEIEHDRSGTRCLREDVVT